MSNHTDDDTSAWETLNSSRRDREISWGPKDDAIFSAVQEPIRFSSPVYLSKDQYDNLAQPGESDRAWDRIQACDESLPREESIAPDVIPTEKQTFAQRMAKKPRYDFTIEGGIPLPKTRRASASTVVSRVFTAATRSVRSLSTSSSALGRRLSSSARSVSSQVVAAAKRWPRSGSVKKKIGRPLSSTHSGSLRLPSAHDAADVHRTDFSSINRLSSANIGRLTLNNFEEGPSSVMASSPPVLHYEPPSMSFTDSIMPSLQPPRQRSPAKPMLRRQPGTKNLQALRNSQLSRVDVEHLFPDDDTTDDYRAFIAAAKAADNSSLRRYKMRELSSVVQNENRDNISAVINDYLGSDSATMFTRGRTPTPLPRSDVLSTPSILRSSKAFKEHIAADTTRAAHAAEGSSRLRRQPTRVLNDALLSPTQRRHKSDVRLSTGQDMYFI